MRYDADCQRIQRGDAIVALALRLANDRWVLVDTGDRRMSDRSWAKPKEVAVEFDAIEAADTVI